MQTKPQVERIDEFTDYFVDNYFEGRFFNIKIYYLRFFSHIYFRQFSRVKFLTINKFGNFSHNFFFPTMCGKNVWKKSHEPVFI